jgi:hypothetical protein
LVRAVGAKQVWLTGLKYASVPRGISPEPEIEKLDRGTNPRVVTTVVANAEIFEFLVGDFPGATIAPIGRSSGVALVHEQVHVLLHEQDAEMATES